MIKNKTEMERMSDKLIRSLNSRIEELKKQSTPENKYLNKDYLKRMKIENRKLKAGYVRAFEQLKYLNNVLRDKLNIDISRKDYFDEIKLAERIKSEIIELSKNEKDNYFNFKSVTSNKFATNKKENNNISVDLSGKIFVITGSLNHYKNRDELVSVIESMGGKVSGSVSAKTSFLINNDTESSSSKNKKAKQLGIPIISEQDFINTIS